MRIYKWKYFLILDSQFPQWQGRFQFIIDCHHHHLVISWENGTKMSCVGVTLYPYCKQYFNISNSGKVSKNRQWSAVCNQPSSCPKGKVKAFHDRISENLICGTLTLSCFHCVHFVITTQVINRTSYHASFNEVFRCFFSSFSHFQTLSGAITLAPLRSCLLCQNHNGVCAVSFVLCVLRVLTKTMQTI